MTPLARYFSTRFRVSEETAPHLVAAHRRDLGHLFADLGYRVGVEVGTWEGAFAQQLCEAHPELHLTCVDPWMQYKAYNEAKNNQARLDAAYQQACERLAPYHVSLLRMPSTEAVTRIPDGSLDCVYVDGNHMEPFVTQDLEGWWPKVRSGGILAGHDYLDSVATKYKHIQVKSAVDRFTLTHGLTEWYVLTSDKCPSFCWMKP